MTVNGRLRTHAHGYLEVGDLLEVEHVVQPTISVASKKVPRSPIEIVFDDESLLVVSKPAHLLTVPTPHRERNTLQSFLTRRLQKESKQGQAYCVHRLDRGVSGLLVFAKTLEVAMQLRDQFADRKPERKYIALVHGRLESPKGTIRSYLATDADLNRYSVDDPTQGELAITHYEQTLSLKNASMISVQLETGRRNQIRVHMAELGHPILGDPRYARKELPHAAWPFRRLALHAESLGFRHPKTGEELRFKSAWPEEFRSFKRKAGLKQSERNDRRKE